ncbi:TetR/AcrR family transcriptional regulator [Antrihabitans sp. YC2-6]|uniref:TetR/AcrR family transcriptional regulator n=1 Tax=Antrihabitans sp. YC2-6 TaxID=2799498 RepID=UPI0035A9597C
MPTADEPVSGHMARWERHNSTRQRHIVEAAVELIEESEPGADIPVQRIAKRAGLAKSVVYRQFTDKDDLDRRIRSFLLDQLTEILDAALNISDGTLEEILVRTIRSVADWATDHARLHEFMRRGPTDYDDAGIDAITSLKARISQRSHEIIFSIAQLLDADAQPFEHLPFAVVTMVEGTLSHWARDPSPTQDRAQVVQDLATYAWFVLDGAARSAGLVVDPKVPLVTVIDQLMAARSGAPL